MVLPEGTVSETGDVHEQVPAGMVTEVVALVILLKAACTSEALQLEAVIVCADAWEKAPIKSARNTKEMHFMRGDSLGGGIGL